MRSTSCPNCGRTIMMDDSEWRRRIECIRCHTQFVPEAAQRARDPRYSGVPPEPEETSHEPPRTPAVGWVDEPAPAARMWPLGLGIFLVGATVLVGILVVAFSRERQRQELAEAERRRAAEASQRLRTRPTPNTPAIERELVPVPKGQGPEPPRVMGSKPDGQKLRLDAADLGKDQPPPRDSVWDKPAPAMPADKPVDPVADEKLQKLLKELSSGNVDLMTTAAEGIGKYGERAGGAAARALCYRMVRSENPALRRACDKALFQVNPELYRVIVDVLHDRDPDIRSKGVEEVIRLGPQAAPAVPALAERLRMELTGYSLDPYLAPRCFQAMALCGPNDPATAQTAMWLSRARSPVMRKLAFEAMGELGAGRPEWRKDFRAALEAARKDPSQEAREAAFKALELIK